MTIAKEFKDYKTSVMSAGCPSVQVTECKRAFYAGALSTLTILGDCRFSTHDGILDDLRILCKELEDFGKGGGL